MFLMNLGLYSISDSSSSASRKCKGYESGETLHALTAQVKKFAVNIFIEKTVNVEDSDYLHFGCEPEASCESAHLRKIS